MKKMVPVTCAKCGRQYSAHAWRQKPENEKYRSKYCSSDCSRSHCTTVPLEKRFWEKVRKTEGCWYWTGAVNSWGYACIWIDRRSHLCSRYVWERDNGPVPEGKWVLHKCDNPACVRPDHLFLDTLSANSRDCLNKKRRPTVKLGPGEVREIRKRVSELGKCQETYDLLAAHYGVTDQTIYLVAIGKTWRWVS